MPYLPLIFSIVILSQAPNLVKMADAPILLISFWRLSLASLGLGLLTIYFKQFSEIKSMSKKQLGFCLLTAAVLFIHFCLWFLGVKNTTVASSAVLFATNPLFSSFGGHLFFKEKITPRDILSLGLGVIGIFIVFMPNLEIKSQGLWGDSLVFFSAILFSAYILLSKKARQNMSNTPFTFLINSFCAILALITIYFQTGLSFNLFFNYETKTWMAFFFMALGPSILGHALFTYCLKFFPVHFMGTSMLLSPVLASLVSYWIYHETPSLMTFFGFFVTTLGVMTLYFPLKKRH